MRGMEMIQIKYLISTIMKIPSTIKKSHMKKIVFFTGAGISRESGLPTFRGEGGLWDEIDVKAVATAGSWYCGRSKDCKERRQRMLDFFNPLRRAILEHEPNEGHRIIADLEKDFDVTVITQNGDDYHSRAGSTKVIHLHGEALKNASTANPTLSYPIDPEDPDIRMGDKAPDGSQLRPYVIFFEEDIEKRLWREALKDTREADWFVVVGSTMLVYPAASLLSELKRDCRLVVIDPEETALPEGCAKECLHIKEKASVGLKTLLRMLIK